MKRGFALLETIIVITFLSVSLLLLYGTFTNMVSNSKKNILYDDVSNIYKAYYVKEYLKINHLESLLGNEAIKKVTCADFANSGCSTLIQVLKVNNMYIAKYDLKEYNKEAYSSTFNNYIDTLSNKGKENYRLILEWNEEDTFSYASIGINGDENE